jgi:hypothetical protein
VTGSINKSACSFLIDHPLDPENRLLRHNCMESPEHLVVYRGKALLDADGEAAVQMPDYFTALAKEDEASIHLTPVGKPFLTGADWNRGFKGFTIYGESNRAVFWEVLAERDDPVIRRLARPVEEDKGPDNKYCDRGKLLCPEAYGYPETMGRDYEKREENRRRHEEAPAARDTKQAHGSSDSAAFGLGILEENPSRAFQSAISRDQHFHTFAIEGTLRGFLALFASLRETGIRIPKCAG